MRGEARQARLEEDDDRAIWELAAGPGFSPRDIPEVAAGYYWEAGNTSGIGTAAFKVIEGNGHSTFDLVQATVANQPTVLTENGGTQFRMRKTGDAVGKSIMATAAAVAAGWTGATYVGMWARLPDASGVVAGFDGFFQHDAGGPNKRTQVYLFHTANDDIGFEVSSTGSNSLLTTYTNIFAGSPWVWVELVFDPLFVLGGSLAGDRIKLFANLALRSRVSSAAVATSITDSSAKLSVGSFNGSTGNGDTLDWAACYYANGIPSLQNRVRLANHRNPTGILLT